MKAGARGQRVRHRSVASTVQRRLVPGQLFATFHTKEVFLNAVTSPNRDSAVGTPEYKVTAVRIERAVEGQE